MLRAIAIAIAITMESIEEQWIPPSPPDILSSSWINIADAKKAVKTWLLDQGEPWAKLIKTTKGSCPYYRVVEC